MAWTCLVDRRGHGWDVDLDRVSQIFGSEAFSYHKYIGADRITERHTSGPDIVRIVFNWHTIRLQTRIRKELKLQRFMDLLYNDGLAALRMLVTSRQDAVYQEAVVHRRMLDAGSDTSRNIDGSVRAGEIGRDIAIQAPIQTLIIGSALVTGGGSLALIPLLAGSGLQGAVTYHNTGSVGQAILQGTFTVVFGVIPMGGSLAGAGRAVVSDLERRTYSRALFWVGVQVNVLGNTTMSLASGEELRPAVIGAMTNEGFGIVAGEVGDDFFNSLAYPMNISARVATGLGTGAASSATSSVITGLTCGNEQRQVVPISGSFSVASAVVAPRENVLDLSPDMRHIDAEYYVQETAMRLAPEMFQNTSQQNPQRQLERMIEGM